MNSIAQGALTLLRRCGRKQPIEKYTMVESLTPKCGLCGNTGNLTKTECCGEWICDDEDEYVMFSFARNSCHRNHRRQTLCAFHFDNGHTGDWADCEKCRSEFDTEDYVNYGTNEYNFRKLPNPPTFEPTRCAKCDRVIDRMNDGFSISAGNFICGDCFELPR